MSLVMLCNVFLLIRLVDRHVDLLTLFKVLFCHFCSFCLFILVSFLLDLKEWNTIAILFVNLFDLFLLDGLLLFFAYILFLNKPYFFHLAHFLCLGSLLLSLYFFLLFGSFFLDFTNLIQSSFFSLLLLLLLF